MHYKGQEEELNCREFLTLQRICYTKQEDVKRVLGEDVKRVWDEIATCVLWLIDVEKKFKGHETTRDMEW